MAEAHCAAIPGGESGGATWQPEHGRFELACVHRVLDGAPQPEVASHLRTPPHAARAAAHGRRAARGGVAPFQGGPEEGVHRGAGGVVREYARRDQFVPACLAYARPAVEDDELTDRIDVTAGNPYYEMQDGLRLPDHG